MNGEVNGTVQEPMDTSISPINDIKVNSDVSLASEIIKQSENSKHSSSDDSQGANNTEVVNQENNSSDAGHCEPDPVNITNVAMSNECINSNESYPDLVPITSPNARSDVTEPQAILNMDDQSKEKNNGTSIASTNEVESEEIDSEEDSSDDEDISMVPEDAVSINSDTDQESEEGTKNRNSDIIIIDSENRPESQNGSAHGPESPEIHEITSDNDDCILTTDEKSNSSASNEALARRRSSKALKQKRYEDVEYLEADDSKGWGSGSDVEEVGMDDPLSHKTKQIVINDTKTLMAMAAKQIKSNKTKKADTDTVVIIDTDAEKSSTVNSGKKTTSNLSINAQNLYQSIIARGTTVTPVPNKTSTATQSSPPIPQPSILPSLTDDMFVVEAPSFIVPYVYEKPSIKPFREFVDVLGKELEEQRAKEEEERLKKEKEAKERRDKERHEKRDRGEEVEESEEEKKIYKSLDSESEEKKKKKAEKRERRRRKHDDDASWDGESSSDSEEETMSDDDTVILKDKADSIEEIKSIVTGVTISKVVTKPDNYFDCSLGKFFVDIGVNLVQEYVQNDLLKQQNRKFSREKKAGHSTRAIESSIASLKKNIEFSKENNAPYAFPQQKCEFCSFKTESQLVMNHHLETPHMKNNLYKCNFCEFEIKSPHDILCHMEAQHSIKGKLERAPAYHQCPNCPFEDNGKGKLARHQIACAKKYKPEINLAPPIEWEPPAKIPKIPRARNNTGPYTNALGRMGIGIGRGTPFGVVGMAGGAGTRIRGRVPLAPPPVPIATPRNSLLVRNPAPSPLILPSSYQAVNNTKLKSSHQPSISITPLPRQPQPIVQAPPTSQSKSTFVICEICDGYIKDLEQLRNHMQWIHKVKIHPKMIYNRPPLNCQKCQFRFFTDQGLERHLLGSHGLVTSSMQEAANKGKDAGRCPVCGRVYQWKLLNHVARDHSLTLKPAHLSYKCTVCTATFGMYKQFENHVYSAHSVVAKRVMDKGKSAPSKSNDSLLKPLKINDEITIIPQPVRPTTSAKDKK